MIRKKKLARELQWESFISVSGSLSLSLVMKREFKVLCYVQRCGRRPILKHSLVTVFKDPTLTIGTLSHQSVLAEALVY